MYVTTFVMMKKNEFKLYQKVGDHCHYTRKFRGAAHNKVSNKIPVVFHNGSTYDYHFIIKELVKKFKGQMNCIGKCITFSVLIKKENKNGKPFTYKIKFIDSYRFMQSKLADLTDNLSEIYKKECQ